METCRSVGVCLLLVGIFGVYAEMQIDRKHEIDSSPARNDNKFGLGQQEESRGVLKSRVARLAPLDRPMKMPSSKQLTTQRQQRERELREQRVAERQAAAAAAELQHGREWERQMVQRDNIAQIVTRLATSASLAEERRNQERGVEEMRQVHTHGYQYRRP